MNVHDGAGSHFGFHWRAPVVMVSSLLVGTALALGHHAFYASLAGSSVGSDPIDIAGWMTTQQQINIAIGTAFAFVVKASLILACSTAYIQLLFKAINRTSFKLSTLDNWFGGLNDLWSFGCLASYWRYPLLTLVAITCWLLPIAAIISPASLSVVFDQIHPSPMLSVAVPQPALDSMALAIYSVTTTSGMQRISWKGPSDEVSRVASAAAAGGAILPINPPAANASWELDFTAPRYVCDPMDDDLINLITDNLIVYFNNATSNGSWTEFSSIMFSYLSWTDYSNATSPVPFVQTTSSIASWKIQNAGLFKEVGVDLFVTIVPRAVNINHEPSLPLDPSDPREGKQAMIEDKITLMKWYFETATMLRCKSMPTTYHVGFSYTGSQDQHIEILSAADATEFYTYDSLLWANVTDDEQLALFGYDEEGVHNNITAWSTEILRLGSYYSIQSATDSLLTGAANSRAAKGHGLITQVEEKRPDWSFQTQVFTTVLANTEELRALNVNLGVFGAYNLTLNESGPAFDEAQSLLASTSNEPVRHFKDVLEELYFNITLSMASSPLLIYNTSSPLAPPPTNVTLTVFGNVYSYGMDKLWLAYGIAIGVTLLNVLVGLWAIAQTGASFTGNFSTIVRVAKNALIEEDMQENTLPGRDPLPKRLAQAEMRLSEGESLLGTKRYGSDESVQRVHVVGYAPPRLDSRGWK